MFPVEIIQQLRMEGRELVGRYRLAHANAFVQPLSLPVKAGVEMSIDVGWPADRLLLLFMLADTDLDVVVIADDGHGQPLSLLAGRPLIWDEGSYYCNPYPGPIKGLEVRNRGERDARFDIGIAIDPVAPRTSALPAFEKEDEN